MHKPLIVVAFHIALLSVSCSDVAPPDSDVAPPDSGLVPQKWTCQLCCHGSARKDKPFVIDRTQVTI